MQYASNFFEHQSQSSKSVKRVWRCSLLFIVRVNEVFRELRGKAGPTPHPDVVNQTSNQGTWNTSVCHEAVNTSLRGSFTKEGPGQPVVSCSKDPGVSVEGQEQSRYSGWHTEVLPEIGESEEVSFNPVFLPLLLALTMHGREQYSS